MPYLALVSASGTIVAAKTGHHIVVEHYTMISDGAGTLQFEDTDGNALTGEMPVAQYTGGSSPPAYQSGLFQTAESAGLVMTVGGSATCEGHLVYRYRRKS